MEFVWVYDTTLLDENVEVMFSIKDEIDYDRITDAILYNILEGGDYN